MKDESQASTMSHRHAAAVMLLACIYPGMLLVESFLPIGGKCGRKQNGTISAISPRPSATSPKRKGALNSFTPHHARSKPLLFFVSDQTAAMKLTADLILMSPQFTNPLKQRELDLRGSLCVCFFQRHSHLCPVQRRKRILMFELF